MILLIYYINDKEDIHGLLMRLIYALYRQNSIQLMRSTCLISLIAPELRSILEEGFYHRHPVLITQWDLFFLPEYFHEKDTSLSDPLIGIVIYSPEVIELGITKEFLNRLEKKFECEKFN